MQAAVISQAEKWADIWKQAGERARFPRAQDYPALPALNAARLRSAALTFPVGTGVSFDNISPRSFARLPDLALDLLAAILMACEKLGWWPEALEMVIIVLIPKDDGDTRPIHLYASVIRLWGRARGDERGQWEADHHRDEMYASKGRAATRVAWQAAFNAKAAHLCGRRHVHGLLDLTKAFDKVDWRRLIDAGLRHGYPMRMLLLALRSYTHPRVLKMRGAISDDIVASCGIGAGSTSATTELKLVLLDVVDRMRVSHRFSELSVYVDDCGVETTADWGGGPNHGAARGAEVVAERHAAAMNDLVGMLVNLGLEVSVKSVMLANSLGVARKAALLTRQARIPAVRSATNLGVAAAGGNRRSTRISVKRLAGFAAKRGRFAVLEKQKVTTYAMARAVGPPSFKYGAGVTGVSNKLLHSQRVAMSMSIHPQAQVRTSMP